jgi:hypothetical protein
MKITSFQLTIQQGIDEQGYSDNFYISIDDKGLTNISRPYKSIPIEEQLAIEEVITSAIKAHIKLVKQVDNTNKDLKLEEYRPIEILEETAPDTEPETSSESAVAQSCALGGGEVSTGADGDIDKPASLVEEIETGDM